MERDLADARKNCTPDACEASHLFVQRLPPSSALRSSEDVRAIETTWGGLALAKARNEPDLELERQLPQRVLAAPSVPDAQRAEAQTLMTALLASANQTTTADADKAAAPPSQQPAAKTVAPSLRQGATQMDGPPSRSHPARRTPKFRAFSALL